MDRSETLPWDNLRRAASFHGTVWRVDNRAKGSAIWRPVAFMGRGLRRHGGKGMNARLLTSKFVALAALLIAAAVPGHAQAQDYPNRLIKIIQGFPPGGNVDLIARIL